jgi:pSer/pThr/pTyr-binding forkhead associated (FHA) protein
MSSEIYLVGGTPVRLFVSLGQSSVNELNFDRGPIYVGRQMGSQVFLPDKSVSRQHAVFYTTKDGAWVVEDLGSSNKTHVNSQVIHKTELKHNDIVRIADFLIRVSLESDEDRESHSEMEDTIMGEQHVHRSLHTVERIFDALDAPPVKFPPKRIKQYHEVLETLNKSNTMDALYKSAMDVLHRQFKAKNIWMAFRKNPTGPMDIEDGKQITTEHIKRLDLALPASLEEAIRDNKYLLIHQLPRQILSRGIRSVIIAPITVGKDNHGVVYIANSTDHPHYNLADMDYLILISINLGYRITKF